jgi:amidase
MSELYRKEVSGFCHHANTQVDGNSTGLLKGLKFAVKDIIDVEGHVTGGGNPEWFRTNNAARRHAPVVQSLLNAGADMIGKTITEEFAYGMIGENFHYGTPRNSAAPGHIPGGSSSGSASVVSAKEVDFALGTDTGGSVRVPASFCGIYGFRPSHGRISLEGVMPLAPSLDTCGWFARKSAIMKKVGEVLLDWKSAKKPGQFFLARDAFALVDPAIREALLPALDKASHILGGYNEVDIGFLKGIENLDGWAEVMRVIRGSEAASSYLSWIKSTNPVMGPGFRERFESGGKFSPKEIALAKLKRNNMEKYLQEFLADGAVIAVPAAPSLPLPVRSPETIYDYLRNNNERYNSMAPLARLPQISLPMAHVGGLPIGLGLIAAHDNDELLLNIASDIHT